MEAVSQHLGESGHGVIVIDAIQYEDKALKVCRGIKAKYPSLQALVLAGRSDIASVAKAIRYGATNYFLLHTPVDELMEILAGALANKPAVADSLFGRVRAKLPIGRSPEGACQMPDGTSISMKDGILQCESLGLVQEDIATLLGMSAEQMTAIQTAASRTREGGLGARVLALLVSLLPNSDSSPPQVGHPCSALSSALGLLGVLVAGVIGWRLLFHPRGAPSQDRFVTLKGTVAYEDGTRFQAPAALVFGLESADSVAAPIHAGFATLDQATGAFEAMVRLHIDNAPPYRFRVALLDTSLLPLSADLAPASCTDLATTPLTVVTEGQPAVITCPKPTPMLPQSGSGRE